MIRLLIALSRKFAPLKSFLEKLLHDYVQANSSILVQNKSAKQILEDKAREEIKAIAAYEKIGLASGHKPPRIVGVKDS